MEAYYKGQQELLFVVPFVAKIIASCSKSEVCFQSLFSIQLLALKRLWYFTTIVIRAFFWSISNVNSAHIGAE